MRLIYPRESTEESFAPRFYPAYRSTTKRVPQKPLVIAPHTLSELTRLVYGHATVRERDNDLTEQHAGEAAR